MGNELIEIFLDTVKEKMNSDLLIDLDVAKHDKLPVNKLLFINYWQDYEWQPDPTMVYEL